METKTGQTPEIQPTPVGVGSGALVSRDLENMACATRMSDAELASHLRTWAKIYDQGELAKWVLGVAAERIEKCTELRAALVQSRDANCCCSYGATQVDAVERANAALGLLANTKSSQFAAPDASSPDR